MSLDPADDYRIDQRRRSHSDTKQPLPVTMHGVGGGGGGLGRSGGGTPIRVPTPSIPSSAASSVSSNSSGGVAVPLPYPYPSIITTSALPSPVLHASGGMSGGMSKSPPLSPRMLTPSAAAASAAVSGGAVMTYSASLLSSQPHTPVASSAVPTPPGMSGMNTPTGAGGAVIKWRRSGSNVHLLSSSPPVHPPSAVGGGGAVPNSPKIANASLLTKQPQQQATNNSTATAISTNGVAPTPGVAGTAGAAGSVSSVAGSGSGSGGGLHVNGQPEVLESLSDMFRLQQLCDVNFVVGPDKVMIGAHRVILAGRSAVFRAQFFGGMKESVDTGGGGFGGGPNGVKSEPIRLASTDPDLFRILLEFLYTGRVHPPLDTQTVVPLMALADYYQVTSLQTACGQHLAANITTENVCVLMAQADAFRERLFYGICMRFVSRHMKDILFTPNFIDYMNESMLDDLLHSDQLNASEIDLFRCIVQWGYAQLQKRISERPPQAHPTLKPSLPAAAASASASAVGIATDIPAGDHKHSVPPPPPPATGVNRTPIPALSALPSPLPALPAALPIIPVPVPAAPAIINSPLQPLPLPATSSMPLAATAFSAAIPASPSSSSLNTLTNNAVRAMRHPHQSAYTYAHASTDVAGTPTNSAVAAAAVDQRTRLTRPPQLKPVWMTASGPVVGHHNQHTPGSSTPISPNASAAPPLASAGSGFQFIDERDGLPNLSMNGSTVTGTVTAPGSNNARGDDSSIASLGAKKDLSKAAQLMGMSVSAIKQLNSPAAAAPASATAVLPGTVSPSPPPPVPTTAAGSSLSPGTVLRLGSSEHKMAGSGAPAAAGSVTVNKQPLVRASSSNTSPSPPVMNVTQSSRAAARGLIGPAAAAAGSSGRAPPPAPQQPAAAGKAAKPKTTPASASARSNKHGASRYPDDLNDDDGDGDTSNELFESEDSQTREHSSYYYSSHGAGGAGTTGYGAPAGGDGDWNRIRTRPMSMSLPLGSAPPSAVALQSAHITSLVATAVATAANSSALNTTNSAKPQPQRMATPTPAGSTPTAAAAASPRNGSGTGSAQHTLAARTKNSMTLPASFQRSGMLAAAMAGTIPAGALPATGSVLHEDGADSKTASAAVPTATPNSGSGGGSTPERVLERDLDTRWCTVDAAANPPPPPPPVDANAMLAAASFGPPIVDPTDRYSLAGVLSRLLRHIRLPLISGSDLVDTVEPAQIVPYPELYRALAYRSSRTRLLYPVEARSLCHRYHTRVLTSTWDEQWVVNRTQPPQAQAQAGQAAVAPARARNYDFSNSGRTVKRKYVAMNVDPPQMAGAGAGAAAAGGGVAVPSAPTAPAPETFIRTTHPVRCGITSWYLGIERCLARYGQKMEVGIVSERFDGTSLSSAGPNRKGRSWSINNKHFATGDVIGIHLNLHAGTVRFECNGQLIKQCTDLTAAALATGSSADSGADCVGVDSAVYFAVAIQSNGNNSGNNQVTVTILQEEDFQPVPTADEYTIAAAAAAAGTEL